MLGMSYVLSVFFAWQFCIECTLTLIYFCICGQLRASVWFPLDALEADKWMGVMAKLISFQLMEFQNIFFYFHVDTHFFRLFRWYRVEIGHIKLLYFYLLIHGLKQWSFPKIWSTLFSPLQFQFVEVIKISNKSSVNCWIQNASSSETVTQILRLQSQLWTAVFSMSDAERDYRFTVGGF